MLPPDLVRSLDYETDLPTEDPVFMAAVRGTPAATLLEDGLLLDLVRYQKPQQAASMSVRTGVFYLPAGSANERHYRGASKNYYGGTEKIRGMTVLRRPLFVKGSTGGAVPTAAYDQLKGKGTYDDLRTDIHRRAYRGHYSRLADHRAVDALLREYGSDPCITSDIVEASREGNQLVYAIAENIVAHAVREAGYDSILGWSRTRAGEPFFSEIFDVREDIYPTTDGEFSLHPHFQIRERRAELDLDRILDQIPAHEMESAP